MTGPIIPTNKLYSIIYADLPWSYKDKSKSRGGGAESHYSCLSVEDLCQIIIPAAPDSILLMWCTYPQLEVGLAVVKAWGFTFKTVAFTWVKTYRNGSLFMGMGRYTRANAEVCLLGRRGKGLPRMSASVRNTQIYTIGRHSEKPAAFREDIVKLFGDRSRIDLFARQSAPGWDVWGNEVDARPESDVRQLSLFLE